MFAEVMVCYGFTALVVNVTAAAWSTDYCSLLSLLFSWQLYVLVFLCAADAVTVGRLHQQNLIQYLVKSHLYLIVA